MSLLQNSYKDRMVQDVLTALDEIQKLIEQARLCNQNQDDNNDVIDELIIKADYLINKVNMVIEAAKDEDDYVEKLLREKDLKIEELKKQVSELSIELAKLKPGTTIERQDKIINSLLASKFGNLIVLILVLVVVLVLLSTLHYVLPKETEKVMAFVKELSSLFVAQQK